MVQPADNSPKSLVSSRSASPRGAHRKDSTNLFRRSTDEARPTRKIFVVEFRSGEAVNRHPELAPLISDGWEIESAVPDVADEGVKLLVVMIRSSALSEIDSV